MAAPLLNLVSSVQTKAPRQGVDGWSDFICSLLIECWCKRARKHIAYYTPALPFHTNRQEKRDRHECRHLLCYKGTEDVQGKPLLDAPLHSRICHDLSTMFKCENQCTPRNLQPILSLNHVKWFLRVQSELIALVLSSCFKYQIMWSLCRDLFFKKHAGRESSPRKCLFYIS